MQWFDTLLGAIDPAQPQTINDSKTPSGRVHVGALRGVLIHDAVYRLLREREMPVRYLFGVDDYDPLDELPAGQAEFFQQYLGVPLCNVPAPPGSDAPDMAEHYIREFFAIFGELGVGAETYRMRDIYREGRFNAAIDRILSHADDVRRVYREVSNSVRADDWYPFQVLCEQCGRVGTTEVYQYDGETVAYRCRRDLVKWAQGCGHEGRISPFDGRGKLPWKLEWVAKWASFPVTIEGAGKDHMTDGGSYDVSSACLQAIYGTRPPAPIPYEFFLVGGAKMSSSRGVGSAAREIADLLPPELLRFLVLRTEARQPVSFAADEKNIEKLFNDFDRVRHRVFHVDTVSNDERAVYHLSELTPQGDYYAPSFSLLLALLQLPHLNLQAEVERRKGGALTEVEQHHLEARLHTARLWLEKYTSEEDRLTIQQTLPASVEELTHAQHGFLHRLAEALPSAEWEDDALQTLIFDTARITPLEAPKAFQAVYRALLDRDAGPKAGSLLAFLDRDFVIRRCQETPFSRTEFWNETAVSAETLSAWLEKVRPNLQSANTSVEFADEGGVLEVRVTALEKGEPRTHVRRVLLAATDDAAFRDAAGSVASSLGLPQPE
jgi:lysyl-tRNA synthetase class 1